MLTPPRLRPGGGQRSSGLSKRKRAPRTCRSGTIGPMRVPDRPWAETNDDGSERSDRLADRLTRLPAGHPSADLAADPDQDHQNLGGTHPAHARFDGGDRADAAPDGLEPDDLGADDLEPGPAGPGDGGDGAPIAGFWPRGSAEPSTWDALGGQDRRPYRPWFSADGAGDPWFAEAPMDQPLTDQHAGAAIAREASRG